MKFQIAISLLLIAIVASGCDAPPGPPVTQRHSPKIGDEPSRELRVAAASDLKFAMTALLPEFERAHPEIKVVPTFGSSGSFYAQISNGAPFDLFLSADVDYPKRLIEAGRGVDASQFLYAVGHLVLWVRKDSPLDPARDGIAILSAGGVNKISIANPAHAPYGRAAVAALKSLGVYDTVESRLVLGDNVAQAAQFVESGAADVGIFALSLAVAPELRALGKYGEVPLDSHPPLEQGGVILTSSSEQAGASAFREFLISDPGRKVLREFGFLLPGE